MNERINEQRRNQRMREKERKKGRKEGRKEGKKLSDGSKYTWSCIILNESGLVLARQFLLSFLLPGQ